jgi:Zn-dependent membrane protease YugP
MFILFIVLFILGIIAQSAVQGRFKKYSKVRNSRGLTGAQAAREILDTNGLGHVTIEEVQGRLSDHYDPRNETLRLSPEVARVPSVAAVGVAAHEAGHALQHARGYTPLRLRSAMVPAVQFGSWLGPIIILAGLALQGLMDLVELGNAVAWFGLVIFGFVAIFALVTLPVELNASARAKKQLYQSNIVDQRELAGVNKVLGAAAWTYVVAALAALVQVLYWASLVMGRRR